MDGYSNNNLTDRLRKDRKYTFKVKKGSANAGRNITATYKSKARMERVHGTTYRGPESSMPMIYTFKNDEGTTHQYKAREMSNLRAAGSGGRRSRRSHRRSRKNTRRSSRRRNNMMGGRRAGCGMRRFSRRH